MSSVIAPVNQPIDVVARRPVDGVAAVVTAQAIPLTRWENEGGATHLDALQSGTVRFVQEFRSTISG